ncbi:Transglutaminase family protein [Frankia sp. AiPs1]|uniref:transglutaminase-like domain-containing protein n=1 Tax=Frankia sp. AiPa1 TaxID=573492 RepID=UPI00202B5E73|nr:transglutaminase family protein [Frankia sp. AiPa1]MCL9758922.1 transglutaminase family protein [Frankia sp. AiPa1]
MTEVSSTGSRPAAHPGSDVVDRVVSCDLTFAVEQPADIALHIAAAHGRVVHAERLDATTGGKALPTPAELATPHRGRIHLLHAPSGVLSVSYRAELAAPAAPGHPTVATPRDLPGLEQLTYLRASRYCPSDQAVGFAVAEFGDQPPGRPRIDAITQWIHHRVGYVAGSSNVHSSATDALLTGQGVCRDFAHLGIMLCRALQIPARFTAVYAPGLTPMDFHAVFEAWFDGAWWTYDATRRAPRESMIRIATGRDAADTAFLNVLGGIIALRSIEVTATVTGALPLDDNLVPHRLH